VFSVNGSGGLTLASTNANAGTHPVALAVEPDGNYLFVADSGTTSASALTIFSIDSSSGSLTPIAGSPYPLQFKPTCLLQSPVLSALFAAAQNEVISIPIASGAPEKYIITIPSAAPTATSPTAIVTDSASRFLYVADSGALIYAYTIASDGTIAAVPGSPFAAGGVKPASLAIDPTGSYLFVANQDSNNVTGFAITQSTGALAPISGSPFAAGAQPSSITFDNKSGNLYVANIGASTVSGYSMNSSTGALTSLGTAFPTTPNPIWLTTVDK
jgi:6-phosphogluconolactonase (cycloisomerase 2 family)